MDTFTWYSSYTMTLYLLTEINPEKKNLHLPYLSAFCLSSHSVQVFSLASWHRKSRQTYSLQRNKALVLFASQKRLYTRVWDTIPCQYIPQARESRRGNDESGKAEVGLSRSLTLSRFLCISAQQRQVSLSHPHTHSLWKRESEKWGGGPSAGLFTYHRQKGRTESMY